MGRVLLTRADRKTLWLSFRCSPGRLQAVLGVLAVTGVLMAVIGASQENNLQTDGVEDGRHYVYDTPPPGTCRGLEQCLRGRTAAGAAQLDARLRAVLAGGAYAVFTAGELRRADARAKRTPAA
ncbi:hypothetical protein ACFQV4_12525 [Streptomyces thermocarboxydus]